MGRSVHCCGLTDGEILSPPHEERGHSHDAAHATVQIQGTVPVQRCRQCTGLDESRDAPDRHRVGHFALVHPPKKLPIFCLDVRLRSATDMRNNSMYCERVFWSASRSIASKNASPCGVDNAETDRTRLGDSAAVCQATSVPSSSAAPRRRTTSTSDKVASQEPLAGDLVGRTLTVLAADAVVLHAACQHSRTRRGGMRALPVRSRKRSLA